MAKKTASKKALADSGSGRVKTQKTEAAGKPSEAAVDSRSACRENVRENVRCRVCLVVDGYRPEETKCKFCGAELFKEDVI